MSSIKKNKPCYAEKEKKPPFNCMDILLQNPLFSIKENAEREEEQPAFKDENEDSATH